MTERWWAGAPNTIFWEGIENEHTKMAGCDTPFTASNYLVTTTPRKEYEIATGQRECPEEDMLDRKKRKVRLIKRIDELKKLALCKKAGLKDYEILAVVSAHALLPISSFMIASHSSSFRCVAP
jgi:hypothetical protein